MMRDTFVATTTALLDDDPRTALVLADISADAFAEAERRHPDRVLNVGIREQLMTGVAGGLALTGLRPYVHTYAPFVAERAYEQLKLDLGHQDAGAVVVTVGASYDAAVAGHTHHAPADVALLDTLDGWTVHVPGHAGEVAPMLRAAARHDDRVYIRLSAQENAQAHPDAADLRVLRRGGPLVVAVGPMLDPVLAATEGMDVTVVYTTRPRPLDAAGLRLLADGGEVVLVEPYLAGTSARQVSDALAGRPARTLHLGVGRTDLRRYGTMADHARAHGLDAAGIRRSLAAFLG